MQFGMPTLIELDNIEDTLNLCHELGLEFIELNMNLPQYQVEQLEKVEYLKMLAEKYKIFYTIHMDENLNICDFNCAVAQAYLDTVKRTIGVAKRLMAPVLNMHMNHGVYFTLPDRKVQLFGQYKDVYMNSMLKFRTMCEKEIGNDNIKICIENTDGYQDYEIDAIELLLESNVFALTWDIGHSNSCNNIDEEFMMKNKERLNHFHIHDGLEKKDHMTLGSGVIDLHQRLELARMQNCRCVIETKTIAALRQSVIWLKKEKFL